METLSDHHGVHLVLFPKHNFLDELLRSCGQQILDGACTLHAHGVVLSSLYGGMVHAHIWQAINWLSLATGALTLYVTGVVVMRVFMTWGLMLLVANCCSEICRTVGCWGVGTGGAWKEPWRC